MNVSKKGKLNLCTIFNFIDVNFLEIARSMDDFNCAQVKAVCVEAGMNALRRNSTFINHEDFLEGIS